MESVVSLNLGTNIRLLREQRGVSQQLMARFAGIPRATWANLESGDSNPTLGVLLKVADALQVRVEELIGPGRDAARHYPAAALPAKRRGAALVRRLLPESLPGLEIDRLELPPGAAFAGIPHTPGTREYLTCERGEIELTVASETRRLEPGDVVVFRGDQRHGYRNPTARRTVAYSVVVLAPASL
jgi:XRE family transcriptional regulator, regulator of sulfur utilization